ncbi:MAG: urea carboxylase [Candidatus Azotimanducaceae bacterium]
MFRKVLVANRGVAAVRIADTLKRLGVLSIGLRTAEERGNKYFERFDEVYDLAGDSVSETYLDIDQILEIANLANAEAVHPGYGFLSENALFASRVAEAGLKFLGPTPEVINTFGLKHEARALAESLGVPILRGSEILADLESARAASESIGFPVLLKSTAGGGGIGMQKCDDVEAMAAAFESVSALAKNNFTSPGVFLEKCILKARHVEVQAFGDGNGNVVVLGDRDCSLQRRNQKLVEECPAPNLPAEIRASMHEHARLLLGSVCYASAGTIEFLYDDDADEYYFLEVNTRLQVEHGVTELVYGVDIVEWMLRLAVGELPDIEGLQEQIAPSGCAIQVRLYAEDPYENFKPTPGSVRINFPDQGRIDTWISSTSAVSHWYDPLLANVMAHGLSRDETVTRLLDVLDETQTYGAATNLALLRQAIDDRRFRAGQVSTKFLELLDYEANEIEIVRPSLETTVQAFPGRQGYWEVGVPPSGPMDDLSFQLGNNLLGNPPNAAGLEIVLHGAKVKFRNAAECVLTGAHCVARLGDRLVEREVVFTVAAGETLSIDEVKQGVRSYLLISGGLDIEEYLGSAATFVLGKFGGHQGRALRQGDVLRRTQLASIPKPVPTEHSRAVDLTSRKNIRVLLGPHAAPDFFTEAWIGELFKASWQVDHNSNRTGVRLIGPTPEWARDSGGEAGLHPSNIHDSPYVFGAMDFTGDMPVILGPDGPSLGGFVCPVVVINADRWKLGQLTAGDSVQFELVDQEQAQLMSDSQEKWLVTGKNNPFKDVKTQTMPSKDAARIRLFEAEDATIRRAGQEWILVEFGEALLDLRVRILVGEFAELLKKSQLSGIRELIPGVRSLLVRFDLAIWKPDSLVAAVKPILIEALKSNISTVRSRIVRLPLSWNDPVCNEAIQRYMKNVRPDAPWCPDNIEFIRRINGLDSTEEVKQIVLDASYFVFGLGDVYLGAPLATPLDPTHRLVTTKYNPARTWTAEGSVGIGGSYMCIYGMEGPGGYQFVGRTIPVWRNKGFAHLGDEPWLLRNYDQIRYVEVDAQELLLLREACSNGEYFPQVESVELDLEEYDRQIDQGSEQILQFRGQRERAYTDEKERWKTSENFTFTREISAPPQTISADESNGAKVTCPISASVWKVLVADNEWVEEGQEIAVLEAMKTEVPLVSTIAGPITMLVSEGQTISAGQSVALVATGS